MSWPALTGDRAESPPTLSYAEEAGDRIRYAEGRICCILQGELMDQAASIDLVAEDLVRRLGLGAYAYVRECAEIAKIGGDSESAITWCDIALAVVEVRNRRELAAIDIARYWASLPRPVSVPPGIG